MGRQSSRLYFQGKDHKDIYYNGHYHDAMYLSDSEGKVTLVWEKIKGTLVKYVSMISYVNGKYYAVVESTDYMDKEGFPILYEGTSLNRMHEKGKIFGDEPVRGASFIMYADSDKLTIIRTYDISEKYIACIPINENGAGIESISYYIENGVYRFSNYISNHRYYYGNGDNYYYGSSAGFFKNENKLEETMAPIINTRDKLVSTYSIIYYTNVFDGNLRFNTFDGNEEFHTYNISLIKILEHARELFANKYSWNTNQANGISIVNILRVNIGYNNIAMASNLVGYILISISLRNVVGRNTYEFQKYYKLKINFDSLALIEEKAVDSYKDYTFYSYMIGNNKYRVQIGGKRTNSNFPYENGISYGIIDDDYENDIFIERNYISNLPSYISSSLSSYKICSLAYSNNILIVRIAYGTSSRYGYIVINIKNKTAEYTEIEMYAE